MAFADPSSPGPAATSSHPDLRPTWTVQHSAELYGLERWGEPYFSINLRGHVSVQPRGERGGSLDLVELVEGLQGRNLTLPLLIRFDDILEDRLEGLHAAFERAITRYGYSGRYQGVFPVKCNQQRHVVEELVSCGRRWHFGLEAGSKAELLIALSLIDDPEALLICNGHKDQRYIETAILARRLGRRCRWLPGDPLGRGRSLRRPRFRRTRHRRRGLHGDAFRRIHAGLFRVARSGVLPGRPVRRGSGRSIQCHLDNRCNSCGGTRYRRRGRRRSASVRPRRTTA